MGRVSPSDPIFGFSPKLLFVVHTTGCFLLLVSFWTYFRSLQWLLKQVQDDGWTVGWRTFGPTLRTDAFHIQQTLHHLEWGRSYHTKLPHIFTWEIKTKFAKWITFFSISHTQRWTPGSSKIMYNEMTLWSLEKNFLLNIHQRLPDQCVGETTTKFCRGIIFIMHRIVPKTFDGPASTRC